MRINSPLQGLRPMQGCSLDACDDSKCILPSDRRRCLGGQVL